MIHTAEVYLWDARIGILHQNGSDKAPVFEYDRDYIRSGIELAPFRMPLSEQIYSFPELVDSAAFRGLPGLVADSLPDRFGNAVIDFWLQSNGREKGSMTPLERLCYTGKRGMGALEYVPSESAGTSDAVDVTELTKLASDILSDKEECVYDSGDVTMSQMLEIGSSAGGARAKAVIALNGSTGEIRSGQVQVPPGFEHWLIKFDNVRGNGDHGERDSKQYTLIEYAYHLMAKDMGIRMSECRILKKDGMSHFMTRRFDRDGNRKVFVQTFSALTHIDYNIPRISGYESCAAHARKLGIGRAGIEEIFGRMVFNVLAMNCDDHVKNISFIMDRQGQWSLSPAYDLTYAYNPSNRWLCEHQMTVNGKSSGITEDDMLASGKSMGLSSRFCRSVIKRAEGVVGDWKHYADECGINDDTIRSIESVLKKHI